MTATLARRELVEPDYWTSPDGIRVRPDPALTYGPEVAELCAKAGYEPDPQQELGLDLIFAIRPDGSPAAFSFCVICARQNLKSGLFLQSVIGWLFVLEVPEIAWSAHELRTSLNAQEELFRVLESPALSKYLPRTPNAGKYDTNGKERQELTTGQTVWFQTRTRDGGRGLGKPKVILDEAFKLKTRTAGALLPILLAQHHPQLLRGSSAPPLDPDAEDLRDVIDRGRKHKSPEMSYIEWLAPKEACQDPDCTHPKDALERGVDCALDREHLLRRANPTLTTGRITIRTLRNLRQELAPAEYMRECLGWADELGSAGPPAVDLRRFNELKDTKAKPARRVAVVLDVEPNQSAASIGLAGPAGDGKVLLTEFAGAGMDWVVDRLERLRDNLSAIDGEILEVALHPSTQAGVLLPDLIAAGFEVHRLTYNDLGRGCSDFLRGVPLGRYVHVDQAELVAAVTVARTKTDAAGMQTWDRSIAPVPLSPLVSTSTAAHRFALLTAKPQVPPPPPRVAKRTAKAGADSIRNVAF